MKNKKFHGKNYLYIDISANSSRVAYSESNILVFYMKDINLLAFVFTVEAICIRVCLVIF